ncbi:hypothetical protein ONZ51_g2687 [Trametes cubensis]|uniref:Uncharacterized protein n=1 Tax=Trametes cubensis TaxID=1111947 RepID=A0AAD7U1U3_9APHY|nr:hypothetical protein ONZ51_g2687 [Trametes cubensis]
MSGFPGVNTSFVLRSDDPLESKLGDTLLFRQDTGSQPHRTLVVSAHTKALYYTIYTEDDDSRACIFRGLVDSPDSQRDAIAIVSTARKHRLATAPSKFHPFHSAKYGGSTCESGQNDAMEKVDTKNVSDADGGISASILSACTSEKEKKTLEDENIFYETKQGASLATYLSNDLETVIITYGRAAPPYLRKCLRMEKQRITLTMHGKTYEFCLDQATKPAIYAVEPSSRAPRSQVAWSNAAGVQNIEGKLHTVFPASLIFYPEVRGFLDAVIVALVSWQLQASL